MLGILLLYFIWKYYSELAVKYNKKKWPYALLGIASYYLGAFFGGIVLALIGQLAESDFPNDMNPVVLSLIAVPFGLSAVWGVYKLLEKKWKKSESEDNDSLDSELFN